MRARFFSWGALAIGIVLFFAALYYVNLDLAVGTIRQLGLALPLALLFSGLWHLVRTWAWSWCFPQPRTVGFLRLARVRLAAEAFSYLTLRGIAGEPLKVVLLADRVNPREATAAVALERLAYLVGTTLIVGVGSLAAIAGLPLTRVWFRVFRAFAIMAAVVAAADRSRDRRPRHLPAGAGAPHRRRPRNVALDRPRRALRRGRRNADAGIAARQPGTPRRPAHGHGPGRTSAWRWRPG